MIESGTAFAGYVIERQLGAGGMGEVYVGRHPRLPRSDAIKVLGTQVSGDAQFRARFQREAELAAGLSHPAIVQVYDQGEDDGRLWTSMQFVDGTDVAKLAAAGPIALPEVARIIGAVADALDFAGSRGLVHRDVKPANILVSTAGHVMLTDFGIARMGAEVSDLTGTGMTVGTLNYASPEQLQGETVDTRSDQYSLAATAYHLLAGTPPFANSNAVKVITGHLGAPVPPLSARRPGLPAAADAVLSRAMAKDPAHRYTSSREFAAALQAALLARHSDVTRQAAQVTAGFTPPPVPAPVLPAPTPWQIRSEPVDPVESASHAAFRTRDALERGEVVQAEVELDGLRDALMVLAGARVGAPPGQLLPEDRDRIRATQVSKRTFQGVEKAFASAVEILDDELRAVAPDKADAVTLPLIEEIAETREGGARTQAERVPGLSRALPARGNWMISAAVIAVSVIVFLVAAGIRGSWMMTDFAGGFPWSTMGILFAAGYLVATANTVIRRGAAGGVMVLAAVVWGIEDYFYYWPLALVMLAISALIPLAWGLGRRRGWRWLWSTIVGPLISFVAYSLLAMTDIYYDGSRTGWVTALVVVLVPPVILTGLLGWLIDSLQHRPKQSASAPSNQGTLPFDPGTPTQLRG